MASSAARVDLDGNPIKAMTICVIGAGGFIGSHLCEKLMNDTPHKVLAVDVYNDKIKHLLEPDSLPWAGRIHFHRINIKNDSRLEGLIKMADLTINLAAICTPADYNTRPLDTIYSNFIDTLPVVKYCSENSKHLIHFSTCEVYGKTIGSYLPKDSPLRQDSSAQILIPSAREPMLFDVAKLLAANYLARLRGFILDPLWVTGVGFFLYAADIYDRVFPITTREEVTIMQDNIAQCKKLLEENNKQNALRNTYIRMACDETLATTLEKDYQNKVKVEEAARVTEQPAAQTKVEKKTRFEAEDLTLSFYRVLSPEF